MNPIAPETLVPCLGWTLLHFLWQGLAIALWLAICLRLLRPGSANQRYLVACAALLAMLIVPAITFNHVAQHYQRLTPAFSAAIATPAPTTHISETTAPDPKVIVSFKAVPPPLSPTERLEQILPWLVIAWAAGVLALSGKLLVGWLAVHRLRQTATTALDEVWQQRLHLLAERLRVSRPVRLLQSALVEVPTVIGWLRPVILLPASCLVGLSPTQLESILAHELAHIRRHDYLVNLLQSAVETLLFYHPAVWWVSRRIRHERENCCDDLAVRVCGDRAVYARALATLEELRATPPQLALAANGAPLLDRIRRLAGRPDKEVGRSGWLVAVLLTLTATSALLIALHSNSALADKTSQPAQTHLTHTNSARQNILAQLDQIRIDATQFNGLPLSEVIKDLNELAKSNDPNQIDIKFFFGRKTASAANGVDTGTEAPATRFPYPAVDPATGLPISSGSNADNGADEPAPRFPYPTVDPATGLPIASTDADTIIVKLPPALTNATLANVLEAITQGASPPVKFSILDTNVVFSLKYPAARPESKAHIVVKPVAVNDASPPELGFDWHTSTNRVATNTNTAPLLNKYTAATKRMKAGPLQINIKTKFVEIDETTNKFEPLAFLYENAAQKPTNHAAAGISPPAFGGTNGTNLVLNLPVTNSIMAQFTGILTEPQYKKLFHLLEYYDGVDILAAPEMITEVGRQAQMQIVDIQTIVTGVNSVTNANGTITNNFITQALPFGPVLDVIPHLSADGHLIEMTIIATVTEFLGYDAPNKTNTSAGVQGPLPRIRLRQLTTSADVRNAQTIVLGGLAPISPLPVTTKVPLLGDIPILGHLFRSTTKPKTTIKNLLVFVTPTLINPDGTLYSAERQSTEVSATK
ncbi:MAG: TonB domain/peptidase domain protein [Pedosphaera sp.]|nr:TonB domain/peptidase domain protein [Pedosphaera sp.]